MQHIWRSREKGFHHEDVMKTDVKQHRSTPVNTGVAAARGRPHLGAAAQGAILAQEGKSLHHRPVPVGHPLGHCLRSAAHRQIALEARLCCKWGAPGLKREQASAPR